ncbi:MAG: tRNA 2-thiouridine(34) synthase MnmA [Christensenellaceae bacterium]|jgi:tRNA-specific 2-thiouridylase|nr:tRNA 2-thiouridine(34) synthase MnmA [Christensenellaceae bacterium]
MKTVVVGMSGGVDSSVTALLLKQQGYNVVGLFMKNWEECDENGVCTATEDFEDVKRVCAALDIPYYAVNFEKEYMDNVFKYFLQEYKKGRTPNPDVLCNREIKFGPLLDKALLLGGDKLATGHYARVEEKDGLYYLGRASDENKDQTYFLNQLTQKQLKYAMFPVGEMNKKDLRELAQKHNLITARKKDSTGICFIGERNFKKFLLEFLPAKSGRIFDTNGEEVGTHDGVMFYTLGQRRGLNIGGRAGGSGRWFVYKKDVKNNILYVSQGDESVLMSHGLVSYDINWIPQKPSEKTFECFVRLRHRQPLQKAQVTQVGNGVRVMFHTPQRAVTEGQYVVFYDEKYCLGGGIIEEVII